MMRPEENFDFQNPDYVAVFKARAERLQRMREKPALVSYALAHYREKIADFITDWGCSTDPRNVEIGRPAFLPLVLWPKQREWIEWAVERWRARQDGLTEKARDSGVTWLSVALSCSLCMLYPGVAIGFGSRKQEYVDEKGAPKSIFEKIRAYMRGIPAEFRGREWSETKHIPYMRAFFPQTGSVITGECGDSIGRGDRASIYFVDEAAHLEHPELADQALSQTTNCRIDISTPFGMANSFAIRRHSGKVPVFTFSWRHDPRKDEAWYAKQLEKYDPVTVAQEIDCSYTASVEGIIIHPSWVQAAVDAHQKLAISPSGPRRGALDVADEGRDLNALAARHGILVEECVSWSGRDSDIFATVERAFQLCDELNLEGLHYDADGLGAGARGDGARINERRVSEKRRRIGADAFRGSGPVFDPDRRVPGTDVKAKDRFQNLKAQSWGALAERFRNTHRAVNGRDYDPDNLISLSSDIRELGKLCVELSQPQWKLSGTGKMMVDKTPEGAQSPNLADALMIAFHPRRVPIRISDALLETAQV